ncbi:MAG: TatD family hydrolase [Thermodesulfobacteriota bacterium]
MSSKKKHIPLPVLTPGVTLIDTHCHLDMMEKNSEVGDIVRRAAVAGIEAMITIGIDLASSRRAVELAHLFNRVYAAIGIHPHHADNLTNETEKELRKLALDSRVIAYGEIGIDTVKNYAPLAVQRRAFSRQLRLAADLDLPVIIHNREAHEEIFLLLEQGPSLPRAGVIHCFSGDADTARRFIDLGFFISFPGVVTFNKAETLQEAVRATPLASMLVETDAPFLAPVPYRGKTNEPLFTLFTAAKIAELKDISLDEVARATTTNARRLFAITP